MALAAAQLTLIDMTAPLPEHIPASAPILPGGLPTVPPGRAAPVAITFAVTPPRRSAGSIAPSTDSNRSWTRFCRAEPPPVSRLLGHGMQVIKGKRRPFDVGRAVRYVA